MIRVERLLRLIHLLHTADPCSVDAMCAEHARAMVGYYAGDDGPDSGEKS